MFEIIHRFGDCGGTMTFPDGTPDSVMDSVSRFGGHLPCLIDIACQSRSKHRPASLTYIIGIGYLSDDVHIMMRRIAKEEIASIQRLHIFDVKFIEDRYYANHVAENYGDGRLYGGSFSGTDIVAAVADKIAVAAEPLQPRILEKVRFNNHKFYYDLEKGRHQLPPAREALHRIIHRIMLEEPTCRP